MVGYAEALKIVETEAVSLGRRMQEVDAVRYERKHYIEVASA